MNTGKSTALLQVAHNYERNGEKVVLVKPGADTKAGNQVQSRLGIEREVDVLATPDDDVRKAVHAVYREQLIRCVLVDEAQFLQPKQVDQLLELAVYDGITVIAYGLRTDFRRQLFPGSQRFFELAHNIEELKTQCRCMVNGKAVFNARFVDGDMVFDGDQVAIDGEKKHHLRAALCPLLS